MLVRLRADGCKGPNEPESVCLYIPVEAGSIDSFVTKALSTNDPKGAKAYLHMADHTVGWVQEISLVWSRLLSLLGDKSQSIGL